MNEIEEMSHVELLDVFEGAVEREALEVTREPLRAEILRRMDSACTSQRQEIRP